MKIITNTKEICRICEKPSTFLDLTKPNHQSYVQQFLSCANVTVSHINVFNLFFTFKWFPFFF